MEQGTELKLFISYSHEDNTKERPFIRQFRKHIAPLRDGCLIKDWYDREILPGKEDYETEIDNNLEDADIICLFISANFLSSASCKAEKKKALELKTKKGLSIVPIILSPCGWQDDKDISKPLALPEDGKPVSSFEDRDEAWQDVYNGLKRVVEKRAKIRRLRITEEFATFLRGTEMLAKAHPRKGEVFLNDVFTPLELDKFNDLREYQGTINSDELLSEHLLVCPKFVIAGEDLSGKTTLCKTIFRELRKRNFVPVYVSDEKSLFRGKIENRISSSFRERYEGIDMGEIDMERIVPIIDNFHLARDKERHIRALSKYPYCVITVDDIFSLNIKDEKLISSFSYFSIRELKPSLRYQIIRKWISLTDEDTSDYGKVDRATELIDSTLGKMIGKGILPAYPFFILSALITYETFAMPLNQEITSQGYCYQALIYFYLKKQGIKEDEIDIYINFLTEIAFYFYKRKRYKLSPDDFASFIDSYSKKYILPIAKETLLKNLSQIVSVDSFNNYSFRYPYLYYFFVAKYLTEHFEDVETKKRIEEITDNLHVNENAYIAIFMAHHSRNIKTLEDIVQNASRLFADCRPATLTKEDIKFFDEQVDIITKAVLPPARATPEKEREKRLKIQDKIEELREKQDEIDQPQGEQEDDFLERDLRKAIKTAEVIGCIIKSRVGSLERTRLAGAFKEALLVHLRILSSFLEAVKNEEHQQAMIDFIGERLRKIAEKSEGELSREETEKYSRTIFWNLNFFFVYAVINKIVHSLGSDKLTEIVNAFCGEVNTPAAFTIKHGILMWYNKHLDIEEIARRSKEKDFSRIADGVIKWMIVNHCALHRINYRDRQKIENKLGIPAKKLLATPYKES